MDYSKIARIVADTIARGGKPLTESQYLLMAGAIAGAVSSFEMSGGEAVVQDPVRYERLHANGQWLIVEKEDIAHYMLQGNQIRGLYTTPRIPEGMKLVPDDGYQLKGVYTKSIRSVCSCGEEENCFAPVATHPIEMLEFLFDRLNHAGVSDCVAKKYAQDINDILASLPPAPTKD